MITSTSNQHVALCRSLHRTRSRREARAFLVEGTRLAREALASGIEPVGALFDPASLDRTDAGRDVLEQVRGAGWAHEVSDVAIGAAAETRTPQGIVMVLPQPDPTRLAAAIDEHLLLVLDSIGDGGNAGTILRSAAAAGLRTVVFAGDSVDPWNGKVVRAGMGAHFRLGIVEAGWDELAAPLTSRGRVMAADAAGSTSIYDLDWSRPSVVIVGSEAHGLSTAARELAPNPVSIPMEAGVESVNAAVAASVILFHAARSGG